MVHQAWQGIEYFDPNEKTVCGIAAAEILAQYDSELFYHYQRNIFEQLVQPLQNIVRFRENEKYSMLDHLQIAAIFERLIRYFFTGILNR